MPATTGQSAPLWEYDSIPYCAAAGNVQRLDNGNTMIGLGITVQPSAVEVTPDGSKVYVTLEYPAQVVEIDVAAQKIARLEDIERRLTVLEEKLLAALLAATPDDDLVSVRAQADRELIPYRSKMPAAQIDQLLKQYIHKRLLEKYRLPRLSLFYMT